MTAYFLLGTAALTLLAQDLQVRSSSDQVQVAAPKLHFSLRDGPYLTLAFPLRNGAVQPLFMMGMNF